MNTNRSVSARLAHLLRQGLWAAATALLATIFAGCGGSSEDELVTCSVFGCPRIEVEQHPQDASVVEGQAAKFAVVVSSVVTNPVSVRWQKCPAPTDPGSCNWQDIAGATGFSLTTDPAQLADNGAHFRAAVTALDYQAVKSNPAKLTVTPAGVPVITQQPQAVAVAKGANASFSVTASGRNLAYQWQRSNDAGVTFNDIAGASAAGYTLAAAQLSDNDARFRVRVTNANGQAISDAARLAVSSLAPALFFDGDFADAAWAETIYLGGNGGTATAGQVASGGNPGSLRRITLTINTGPAGAISSVFAFYWKSGAIYDPVVSGSIVAVDYAEDYQGPGQASGLVLRQGGKVYYAVPAYQVTGPGTGWTHKAVNDLVATDFVFMAPDLSQTPEHPDFSALGQPIQFGFVRANSTGVGGAGYTKVGNIDNWSVTIHR